MGNTVFIATIDIPGVIGSDCHRTIIKPVFAPNIEIAKEITEEHYKDISIKSIEIEEPIRYVNRIESIRNKIDEDLLNFGVAITRERDGKIDYIDPMSPEGEKLRKESKKDGEAES